MKRVYISAYRAVFGVMAMSIDSVVSKYEAVKAEFDSFISGEKSPLEAARAVQSAIGEISGYKYKSGSLTVDNCTNRYSIPLRGGGRSYDAKVEEFKAALRIVANGNGSSQIEDHLDKGCSTKHYARKFWEYASKVEHRVKQKYGS